MERRVGIPVLVGVLVTACAGSGASPKVAPPAGGPSPTVPPVATNTPIPSPTGEPLNVAWISDSTGSGGVPEAYGRRIEADLGLVVEVQSAWTGLLSIAKILNVLQGADGGVLQSWGSGKVILADAIRGADVIVVSGNQTQSDTPGHPQGEGCSLYFESNPTNDPVTDSGPETWQQYESDLVAVFDEIFRIRDGRPVILRTHDWYLPWGPVATWTSLDRVDGCAKYWHEFSDAIHRAAAARNVPVAGYYAAFSGGRTATSRCPVPGPGTTCTRRRWEPRRSPASWPTSGTTCGTARRLSGHSQRNVRIARPAAAAPQAARSRSGPAGSARRPPSAARKASARAAAGRTAGDRVERRGKVVHRQDDPADHQEAEEEPVGEGERRLGAERAGEEQAQAGEREGAQERAPRRRGRATVPAGAASPRTTIATADEERRPGAPRGRGPRRASRRRGPSGGAASRRAASAPRSSARRPWRSRGSRGRSAMTARASDPGSRKSTGRPAIPGTIPAVAKNSRTAAGMTIVTRTFSPRRAVSAQLLRGERGRGAERRRRPAHATASTSRSPVSSR